MIDGVLFENRRSREAKKLGFREEVFYCVMVIAKLRSVALVKNKYHAPITQFLKTIFIVLAAVAIKRQAKLLNCGDDYLIGIIV